MDINFTLVQRKVNPLVQAGMGLLIGWAGMGIVKLTHQEPGTEYFAAFVAIIFFCLINTIVSLAHESYIRYTLPSYWLYILMVVLLLLSAKGLSHVSIWTVWEYRMMLLSISIFYVIVSTLIRGMRFIFEMAEKEL